MRILSQVVAVVLALSLAGSTSWASSSGVAPGNSKAPAHASATDKSKSGAKKPESKKGEVNLGSSERQELLKNKQSQSKSVKGKAGALPKKKVLKKS